MDDVFPYVGVVYILKCLQSRWSTAVGYAAMNILAERETSLLVRTAAKGVVIQLLRFHIYLQELVKHSSPGAKANPDTKREGK